jgi:hypothetical protein
MPYLGNGLTKFTTADELTVTGDATAGGTLGVTGVVTANAGVVVDNITIDGSEIDLSSGNLTIDAAGYIIIDSDDGNIYLNDATVGFGQISGANGDLTIKSSTSDKDMIFQGNDGGSVITALTLDMSAAGAAAFNTSVGIGCTPERDLHVKGAANDPVHFKLEGDASDYGRIMFDDGTDDNIGEIRYDFGSDFMQFTTNASESMYIDNAGNIGMGFSPPRHPLHVYYSETGSIPTDHNIGASTDNKNYLGFHNASDSATYSGIALETRTSGAARWLIANEWKTTFEGDLVFRTRDGGTSSSEVVRFTKSTVDITGGFTATDGCTITTADNTTQLTLKSTDADGSIGPKLDMIRDSSSPADDDNCGQINFRMDNDAGQEITFATIFSGIKDVTDGDEDGHLTIDVESAGALRSRLEFQPLETVFNQDSNDINFRVESDEHGHAFFVDGEDGNISMGLDAVTVDSSLAGVSVPSGSRIFNINDADGAYLKLTDPSSGANRGAQFALIGTDAILNNCESGSLIFGTGNSESGRFNGANFLVGKTASGNFDQGSCELNNTGYLQLARDDGAQIFISRQGSSQTGDMIALYKVNAKQGSIGNIVDRMYIGSADTGLVFEGYFNDCIIPFSPDGQNIRDNLIALGYGSSRFSEIFCANSTINTSDETEKQDISVLTSAEMTAAKSISALFKTYKWKDAVAAKSGAARIHAGVVAQEVQKAMSDAGLDAAKYAFWCSDTWWEVEETTTNDDGEKRTRMVPYQKEEDAPEGATKRTRLGVRYPELLAFIGAATEQRLADIETRLAALEA